MAPYYPSIDSLAANNNMEDIKDPLQDLKEAFSSVIDNDFNTAMDIVGKDPDRDLYYKFATALLQLEGLLALDKIAMKRGAIVLKEYLSVVHKQRHNGWSRLFFKQNYDSYSDEQVHAELITAEATILLAAITVMEDQSFLGFINAALYVRTAHSCYRECLDVLQMKTNWKSAFSKEHFESGVRMALGGFDLFISYLPGKFSKLLEYVGFSGEIT